MNNSKPTQPAEPQVTWRVPQWYPDLGENNHAKLKVYFDELQRFNKTLNLVSPKTLPFADVIHFADCILAAQLINSQAKIDHIYDIGSGNGFPGLIFALLTPRVKVSMIEKDSRKCEYLKHMTTQLDLKNCEIKMTTLESLPDKSIKFAMSRGFASIPKALLMCRRQFVRGGQFFHLKSEEWATEVAQIPSQLCTFWQPSLLGDYRLPVGEVKFSVVKTEKIAD